MGFGFEVGCWELEVGGDGSDEEGWDGERDRGGNWQFLFFKEGVFFISLLADGGSLAVGM